ncbi:pentapeptide repeat-containing protein [Rhizobium ruizarguesonis]
MVQPRFLLNQAIEQVLNAPSDRFTDLAELAGLDPARDFRRADLRECDFRECDLTGFDFIGARLDGSDFGGALVSGALFDKRTIDSGVLSTALDFYRLLTGERPTERENLVDLLDDIPRPFLWDDQLWKIVGCLRAGKSVNVHGSRGSGKTLLLHVAEKYLARHFNQKVAFIEAYSGDLGESLLCGLELSARREAGKNDLMLKKFQPTPVEEALQIREKEYGSPILFLDDAHTYAPAQLSAFVSFCEAAKSPFVLSSMLPIAETAPEVSEFGGWLIPAPMPRLDNASVAMLIKTEFEAGAPPGLDDLFQVAAGLNVGQVRRLANNFRKAGSASNAFLQAFVDETFETATMDGRPFELARDEIVQVFGVFYRAKGAGVSLKQMVARTKMPLEQCESVIDYLRTTGFVVRKNRRSFILTNQTVVRMIISAPTISLEHYKFE